MTESKKNIVGFKKFSDMKKSNVEKSNDDNSNLLINNIENSNMEPNLPNKSTKSEVNLNKTDFVQNDYFLDKNDGIKENIKTTDSYIDGKIAKFTKNIKASSAYNYLENLKVSKKSIWYIMIESQNSELKMVKYNYKEGVDLYKFINELKSYYSKRCNDDPKNQKLIENIKVDGNDKYSMIKNIPSIEMDGKKMITKITEDLIKLLKK